MTGDPDDFMPDGDSGSGRLAPGVEAEIHRLADLLLEHRISQAQQRRLEQIVSADPAATEVYLSIMYEWGSLPNYVGKGAVDISATDVSDPVEAPGSEMQLNETMILPAVHAEDLEAEDPPVVLPAPVVIRPARPRRWIGFAAAAALAATGLFAVYRLSRPPTPVAAGRTNPSDIAATTPVVTDPPSATPPPASVTAISTLKPGRNRVGESLATGRELRVDDGAIELTFAGGAVVVVQAPARVHVVDQNGVALDDGAMTAHVPVPARGFRVISPGMFTVDRGTDFGVRTRLDGTASEVHVFGGIVDVAGTGADGRPAGQAVRAVAGDAFGHAVADPQIPKPVGFSPQSFDRDIAAIHRAIPMHNTGDGLAGGQPDPNWVIKSAPDALNWKPRPAVVISEPVYTNQPNSPTAKWLSTDGSGPPVPSGYYIFSTTVDLTGFDPSTAKVQAVVTADDLVTDIRINGVSTGLKTHTALLAPDYKETTLDIPARHWRPGINQVEFVIHNDNATDVTQLQTQTQMGLQVRWLGDACTAVQR